ncbi:hypothetical protein EN780_03375 [Mesorhizobium sp. M4B.F.Ca.ET.089.01.1.1]|uniref:DUF7168 domain-containing protein n=1 Tax=Mesorhizobium sp. M4B.F.Ca.ET.089.01.1.1 TaxID=2496662 RepID=UPI000FE31ACA|nr:hypothetical protein [Mesorhizobium sp. M4B.F.Ca.ET.089.01.1.1]RWX70449.1 hypothetical protein EN780_03375 [Mesorhizobium sp. M4B.F.Ca.ET.089.01.1.1]
MSDPKREKLAKRIRALAAMTVENGCTEDEAIVAARKLADTLAEHNMTLDEAMMREQPFAEQTRKSHDDLIGERLWKPADAISFLTGSRYWSSANGVYPTSITFFGFDHEVEVARYMLAICSRAMQDGKRRVEHQYALKVPAHRRAHVIAYLDGMADTLRRRIRALKPATPTGSGLIVLHRALIDAALKERGTEIEQRRTRASRDLDPSYLAGAAAGERVSLNQGVTANRETRGLLA